MTLIPHCTACPMSLTPVLLLHPFSVDCRFWQPQIDRLQCAAPERRLVAWEIGGFGRRSAAELHESVDLHARDVVAELDRRAVVRAYVVGLSMGGYVALALHRLAPERVAGLLLANTTAKADSADRRRTREEQARRYEREGIASLPDEWIPLLVGPACSHDTQLELRRLMLEQSPHGVAAALRMMGRRPDRTSELCRIAVPTIVVAGEHDPLTPPSAMAELAHGVRGAELYPIPGVGHLTSLEAPDHFNYALMASLARVDGREAES